MTAGQVKGSANVICCRLFMGLQQRFQRLCVGSAPPMVEKSLEMRRNLNLLCPGGKSVSLLEMSFVLVTVVFMFFGVFTDTTRTGGTAARRGRGIVPLSNTSW